MLNFNFPLQPHQNYNITQYVWKPRSINFEEKANKLRRNGQVSLFVHLVTSKQMKNHTNKLIVDQKTRMNVQCAKLGEKISRNFATGFGNLVAKWNILVAKVNVSLSTNRKSLKTPYTGFYMHRKGTQWLRSWVISAPRSPTAYFRIRMADEFPNPKSKKLHKLWGWCWRKI